MEKLSKICICILLSAILIGLIVPASNAKYMDSQTIGSSEKQIASQINIKDNKVDISKSYAEAENIRAKIVDQMRKDMSQEVSSSTADIQAIRDSTVYLGTDASFTSADYSNKGSSWWGIAPYKGGSEVYLSERKDEAASLVGPGGVGGFGAWAKVGNEFTVSGSGSRSANIRITGQYYGLTMATGGGSADTLIKFVVEDVTTGAIYQTECFHRNVGILGWSEDSGSINHGVSVNLQADHTYRAYLELQTSSAVGGIGMASSDYGRQDDDYSGEGTSYNSIIIDF